MSPFQGLKYLLVLNYNNNTPSGLIEQKLLRGELHSALHLRHLIRQFKTDGAACPAVVRVAGRRRKHRPT